MPHQNYSNSEKHQNNICVVVITFWMPQSSCLTRSSQLNFSSFLLRAAPPAPEQVLNINHTIFGANFPTWQSSPWGASSALKPWHLVPPPLPPLLLLSPPRHPLLQPEGAEGLFKAVDVLTPAFVPVHSIVLVVVLRWAEVRQCFCSQQIRLNVYFSYFDYFIPWSYRLTHSNILWPERAHLSTC